MRRWMVGVLAVLPMFAGPVGATAQTALIGGGLTALPGAATLGPSQVQNGGFETGSGAGWNAASGWGADQLVTHTGGFSFRTTGGGNATQTVQVKAGVYTVSAWIKTDNLGGSNQGVRLTLDLRPAQWAWFSTSVVSGTQNWTYYEVKNVVVAQDQAVTVSLDRYNGPSGTAWFDDVQLQVQPPTALDVFMLYPNYRGMLFDDQSQTLRFEVSVTPPGGDFSRYSVRATLADEATGAVATTQDFPAAAKLVAQLDGGAMQQGRPYLAKVTLVDRSSGAQTYAYPAFRVSRVPGAARTQMNISFDEKNRILFKGKPRFVLGVYDSGLGYTGSVQSWEDMLWSANGDRRMDGLRINMYLNYWYGQASAESMNALMQNLQNHGVTYLQTGNCFDTFAADAGFAINSSDGYVQGIGSQAGSAGYYTADECKSTLIPGVFDQYTRLRRLDPDSMTFAALLGNGDVYMWRDAADVLSTDPYPMYGAEPSGGYAHHQVADWTQMTRDAVKDARPYLTVLQFFKFTSLGRFPTLAEMRSHAYMAIVEGARGLFWWSLGQNALYDVCPGWCAERTGYMNNLKALVGELADLEPVLLADDAPNALASNSNANAVRTKVKVVNGTGYVFAYNYTNGAQTATFGWNTAPGTVQVNGEGRSVAASGNSFSDSFGPYAAHVYVIGNGGSAGSGSGAGGSAGTSNTGGTGGSGGTGGTGGAVTVSFTNPAVGATVSGTTTVTLNATGGTSYSYSAAVDGTNIYAGSNPTFSWNTTNVANGTHTLAGTVTEGSGRTATATRSVTVSNVGTTPAPTGKLPVYITSPTNGSTVSGTSAVNVWVEQASGSANTFTVTADGTTVTTQTLAGAHLTVGWDTTKLGDGTHVLTAAVKDATGQTGTASVTVTVKNGNVTPAPAPQPALGASITSPAGGATVNGTTTVTMASTGATGSSTFQLALDGRAVSKQTVTGSTATWGWDTKTATNGAHTLALTVTDGASRTATTTRGVTVSNVTTAPAPVPAPTGKLPVYITSPTNGSTVSGTASVNVWVEQSSGSNTFTMTVDGAPLVTQTLAGAHLTFGWDTTKLGDGTHVLTVAVKDATGQTGTASVTVTLKNGIVAATPAPALTPPTPAPVLQPAPASTLPVYITGPKAGATVAGTAWVDVWVEQATGTSTFALSVDGVAVTQQQTTGAHVTLAWPTGGFGNGSHAVRVTVTDGSGKTGTGQVTVTVNN